MKLGIDGVLKVFVIMPLSKTKGNRNKEYWQHFYDRLETMLKQKLADRILKLFEVTDIEVHRAEAPHGNIVDEIIKDLVKCDIVISVITDYKPNVLYELGIRHCLAEKPTVMLIQERQKIPFDFTIYGVVKYPDTTERDHEIEEGLMEKLQEIACDISKPDNPVTEFKRKFPKILRKPIDLEDPEEFKVYLKDFVKRMSEFSIEDSGEVPIDEHVLKSIQLMTPMRDELIEVVKSCLKSQKRLNIEEFQPFFEELVGLIYSPDQPENWMDTSRDHFKFIMQEIVLYVVALLLQAQRFEEVTRLSQWHFFQFRTGMNEPNEFDICAFNRRPRSLEEIRKERLNLDRLSVTAHIIKERADKGPVPFGQIREADIVLFYLTLLRKAENLIRKRWFPNTCAYCDYHSKFEFFKRAISRQHFDKLKVLFSAKDKSDFLNTAKKLDQLIGLERLDWDYEFPRLGSLMNLQRIADLP